jgi:hypothetical protein
MTPNQIKDLFKALEIQIESFEENAYMKCCAYYEKYWQFVMKHIREKKPKKVILFFLESVPEKLGNNMFSNGANHIKVPEDSYLWNICRGFFKKEVCSILTKDEALEVLLKFRCNGENVPVIILDLFPFHGMNLKDHRSKIVNGFSTKKVVKKLIIKDVNVFLKKLSDPKLNLGKYFLFGVPYSIWNGLGGAGQGSLYMDGFDKKEGPLGTFINEHAIRNVGGQGISYNNIVEWRKREGL